MECGPASQPSAISSVRSARILLTIAGGVAFGFVRGRRDLGSRASQPPRVSDSLCKWSGLIGEPDAFRSAGRKDSHVE